MSKTLPADPRPQPPVRPSVNDCCRSGCDPCVFELYQGDLERYREQLRAWEQRQEARPVKGKKPPE